MLRLVGGLHYRVFYVGVLYVLASPLNCQLLGHAGVKMHSFDFPELGMCVCVCVCVW